jgi:hypothetical protein
MDTPLDLNPKRLLSLARECAGWHRYRARHYRRGLYRFEGPERLVLGKYKKILIIRINHSYAGFFAYFTIALNQILFCERNQCLPVINFGEWSEDGENAFYDEAHGPNMWEYYFEPVADYGYADIQEWIQDDKHPVQADDVVTLTHDDIWYLHLFERRSVFAYTYGLYRLMSGNRPKWYARQRQRAHEVIQRWVRVKKDILDQVDQFYAEHMKGRAVLGVHLRGTDKGAAEGAENTRRKIGPDAYFPEVDRYLQKQPDARVFVATDQVQYLEAMRERYPDRVVASDCLRSLDERAPFQMKDRSGYLKGAEVLIDALLLARSDFLLKSSSHVAEAALWFNPTIPCVDLNYPQRS